MTSGGRDQENESALNLVNVYQIIWNKVGNQPALQMSSCSHDPQSETTSAEPPGLSLPAGE